MAAKKAITAYVNLKRASDLLGYPAEEVLNTLLESDYKIYLSLPWSEKPKQLLLRNEMVGSLFLKADEDLPDFNFWLDSDALDVSDETRKRVLQWLSLESPGGDSNSIFEGSTYRFLCISGKDFNRLSRLISDDNAPNVSSAKFNIKNWRNLKIKLLSNGKEIELRCGKTPQTLSYKDLGLVRRDNRPSNLWDTLTRFLSSESARKVLAKPNRNMQQKRISRLNDEFKKIFQMATPPIVLGPGRKEYLLQFEFENEYLEDDLELKAYDDEDEDEDS